jgi:ATP-dependent Clp protease ATP-binding subunit ClpC
MLSGIEAEGGNLALVVLDSVGVDRNRLRSALPDSGSGGQDLDRLIERAVTAATDLGNDYVGCEHLLLALVADPAAPAARLLAGLGADPATLTRATCAAAAAAAYARAAAFDEVQARLTTLDR